MAINSNISRWIEKSELVIDYYTMFIKVWIPFNAWYMHNFYDEDIGRTSDRKIIDHIKDNDNSYKDEIKNLLSVDNENGKVFRDYLNKLHIELTNNPIPNYENRIGFDYMVLSRNTNTEYPFSKGHYNYKCKFNNQQPRETNRFICEVFSRRRENTTLHRIELREWNMGDLERNSVFTNINNDAIKENIKNCFEEINPKKPTKIIVEPNIRHTIKISEDLHFKNDENLVTKVIIELIYGLRCKLFHGEIEPKKAYEKIYEYAYHIQRILIQTLQ